MPTRRKITNPPGTQEIDDIIDRLPPLPAVVVADKRNHMARRLLVVGVGFLLMFALVEIYNLTSDIKDLAQDAADDRRAFVEDEERDSAAAAIILGIFEAQQDALVAQNERLVEAGLDPVPFPPLPASATEPSTLERDGMAPGASRPAETPNRPTAEPRSGDRPGTSPAEPPPAEPRPAPPEPQAPPPPPAEEEEPGLLDPILDPVCGLVRLCTP